MNLYHIESFIETVRTGSMSQAAKKLFLSQPAVSMHIQKLEKELGCTLLDRNSKKVKLTAEGKVFLRYAEYVHHGATSCMANISRIKSGMLGVLNFVTSSVAGEYVLPPILNEFKVNYEFVDVNISIVDQADIVDTVLSGEDVLGFIGIKPERRSPKDINSMFNRKELGMVRVGTDQQVFVVHAGHPLATKTNVSVSDIEGEPLIIKEIPQYTELKEFGIDLEHYSPKIITGSIGGIVSAVSAKLGIGIASRLAVEQSMTSGLIRVLDTQGFHARRDLYCIYDKTKQHTALTNNFIHFLKEVSAAKSY